MIVFPSCKINLGLRILRKRGDGYHDLETLFYPVPFREALEIIPAGGANTRFTSSGLALHPGDKKNLCIRAYELLKADFPALPLANIHLHKTIPAGGGLGGGSADAAFTLCLLNRKFSLGISPEGLLRYALQLGSDCPFFILNKPCLATGRGEIMEPVSLQLSAYALVLVNPGIHVSTPKAFAGIVPALPEKPLKEIIGQPVETWQECLVNDFEVPVFARHPEIKNIKQQLYKAGALYASLSGSGSTVYGIFPQNGIPAFSFPASYFVKKITALT